MYLNFKYFCSDVSFVLTGGKGGKEGKRGEQRRRTEQEEFSEQLCNSSIMFKNHYTRMQAKLQQ